MRTMRISILWKIIVLTEIPPVNIIYIAVLVVINSVSGYFVSVDPFVVL